MMQPRAGGISHSLPFVHCASQVPSWQIIPIIALCVLCNKPVRDLSSITRGTKIITGRDIKQGKLVQDRPHVDLRRNKMMGEQSAGWNPAFTV
jgi:hypothetical protein